ncbi:MAG: hypothetical protein JXX14_17105 [Deltaproteobacteria bacterium]|nr:hypothetical protein [Deltaproteobacteria bacterium]
MNNALISTSVGLDIGSNTVSCTQLHRDAHGKIHMQHDKSFPVRLSEGLVPGGVLKPEAIARALDAIEKIARKFDYRTSHSRAVATAVLRMTSTPDAFTGPAKAILGTPVEIIDAAEEARYTAIGAVFDLPARDDWAILDIGGQSTELSCHGAGGAWESVSMPLGVVGLTERFFSSDMPSREEQEAARDSVRTLLQAHMAPSLTGQLVCVGGTPTTLSKLVHRMERWDREKVHGSPVSLAQTQKWLDISSAVDVKTRIEKFGMKPGRADIFPAGVLILDEMLQYLGKDSFTVSANGLRVGLALTLLDN